MSCDVIFICVLTVRIKVPLMSRGSHPIATENTKTWFEDVSENFLIHVPSAQRNNFRLG